MSVASALKENRSSMRMAFGYLQTSGVLVVPSGS